MQSTVKKVRGGALVESAQSDRPTSLTGPTRLTNELPLPQIHPLMLPRSLVNRLHHDHPRRSFTRHHQRLIL